MLRLLADDKEFDTQKWSTPLHYKYPSWSGAELIFIPLIKLAPSVRAPDPQLFPDLNTPKVIDSYVTMFYFYNYTHYLPINVQNVPSEDRVYRSKKRMFENKTCIVVNQKIKKLY